MAYRGLTGFSHNDPDRVGVLLTNLGTPDAPTKAALRRYLKEFLWDPRVVEIPRPLWWLILNGVILNTRPSKSAKNYASIWTDEGSPLFVYTRRQKEALEERIGEEYLVEFGFRYGNPSLSDAMDKLLARGARKIVVVPLYPQYCAATTASTFDAIAQDLGTRRWLPELRFVSHYHDYVPYIEACCAAIAHHWAAHGQAEKLILSYHGIPRVSLDKGDPYFCECHKTSRLIADSLGLGPEKVMTTFQSRFGKAEWLQPYTDRTLQALPGQGVKSVDVFCPGFAADCLETLEEIAFENKGYFLSNGGERFHYIPALNASSEHIDALESLIRHHTQGWQPLGESDPSRASRARALGADK